MSPEEILDRFAQQVGFEVEREPDVVRLLRVPCLYSGRLPGTCTIETSIDPATGKPDGRISGGAVHAVRVTIDEEHDGLVYSAGGVHIGNPIAGDQKTWCCISIHKGAPGQPESGREPTRSAPPIREEDRRGRSCGRLHRAWCPLSAQSFSHSKYLRGPRRCCSGAGPHSGSADRDRGLGGDRSIYS